MHQHLILDSASSGQFLKNWIALNSKQKSLGVIAKKCGLASKGALHDILTGRRRPKLESLNRICLAMKIRGPEKKLLLRLWQMDSPKKDFPLDSLPSLAQLKEKVLLKNSKQKSPIIPFAPGWDYVYSALGGLEEGVTLEQVSKKTGLSPLKCADALRHLMSARLVTLDEETQKYRVNALHSLHEEDSLDEKTYLIQKVKQLQGSISKDFGKRDQTLYRNLVFSIPEGKFALLREKLKTVIDEFSDEHEVSQGQAMAELFLSFELK